MIGFDECSIPEAYGRRVGQAVIRQLTHGR